jgi:predicted transcriptional regulator
VRTSVILDDEVFRELLEITQETNRTRAVQVAVAHFIRDAKLERLRRLKGKVSILGNEEIEAGELAAQDDAHFRHVPGLVRLREAT